MSILVPFKAIRPKPDKARAVASRPYDVLSVEEARELAKGNDLSFYHVIKPEIDFPDDYNVPADEVYQKGAENLRRLIDRGVMVQDENENFFAYQIEMGDHIQTGLVGCCAIEDYFSEIIKKHELTRPDKEEDRKNHVRCSKMNYEPVFFSYPHVEEINLVVDRAKNTDPLYDITTSDGVGHKLWAIGNEVDVDKIVALFDEQVPSIYIADGHHRTAAGALIGKEIREAENGNAHNNKRYNYFMAVLFPDNELKIIDYNRLVKDLNGLSEEDFLIELKKSFEVERVSQEFKPGQPHEFGMYMNHHWYRLVARNGTYKNSDPIDVLDVTILSKQLLHPVLGIEDLRTDNRIEFVGGIRGLSELKERVDSGEMKVAFALYPVSMQQLVDISDNNMIMPPKVTWFEPKLRSGLFVHDLSE